MPLPTRPQQLGLLILLGLVSGLHLLQDVASAPADTRHPGSHGDGQERARHRARAAARRRNHQLRFDRRVSRLRHRHRQGADRRAARHPHHLIDVVEPTEEYTAARYVRDAVAAIEQIYARGRWPILVGGTGLYYRALVRGLFPGPGADAKMRGRLEAIARRRGVEFLHRMLKRVDPPSAGAFSRAISNAWSARSRCTF